MREAAVKRETKETKIEVRLNLDGEGKSEIKTGIGFFDHMLEQIARHGQLDLTISCAGDLEVDSHHSIEDTGLALGRALKEALGDKAGITRYGQSYVPMDEALVRVVLDFSGRAYLHFSGSFPCPYLGAYSCEMTKEFFRAVASEAGLTLHMDILHGENSHHMTEALYKAFGRALRMAAAPDPKMKGIPSTKGVL